MFKFNNKDTRTTWTLKNHLLASDENHLCLISSSKLFGQSQVNSLSEASSSRFWREIPNPANQQQSSRRNTRKRCKIYSKLTKRHQNNVNDLVLVSLLLTLNAFCTLWRPHSRHQTNKCLPGKVVLKPVFQAHYQGLVLHWVRFPFVSYLREIGTTV